LKGVFDNKCLNLRQKTVKDMAQMIDSKPMTNDEIPAANSALLS
jgi:hypothetical protein